MYQQDRSSLQYRQYNNNQQHMGYMIRLKQNFGRQDMGCIIHLKQKLYRQDRLYTIHRE